MSDFRKKKADISHSSFLHKMRGEADLENIKDFPLEDLILEDNPIVQRSNYTR